MFSYVVFFSEKYAPIQAAHATTFRFEKGYLFRVEGTSNKTPLTQSIPHYYFCNEGSKFTRRGMVAATVRGQSCGVCNKTNKLPSS